MNRELRRKVMIAGAIQICVHSHRESQPLEFILKTQCHGKRNKKGKSKKDWD